MAIKRILVSQPKPSNEKSPYYELAEKHNLEIDFKPFIHVEGLDEHEFRKSRINILDHTAIIMTSRTAIDHFFRICDEVRATVPDTMKYFCTSESVAFYLQKYITYRKRKIFYGNGKFQDLMEIIKKHKKETFLVPLSDCHKKEIPRLLDKNNINYTKAILYRTVSSDLSDIKDFNYDMLVFYSPAGIKSLKENFPDFEQNNIKIASFGPNTAKAAKNAGLTLDVKAPTAQSPSMIMALENYLNNNHQSSSNNSRKNGNGTRKSSSNNNRKTTSKSTSKTTSKAASKSNSKSISKAKSNTTSKTTRKASTKTNSKASSKTSGKSTAKASSKSSTKNAGKSGNNGQNKKTTSTNKKTTSTNKKT